jgi:two-component system, chemotaxis family, sensor kinase Cph1
MSEHSTPLGLTDCDREPIHIPGAIQPHGVLLVLEEQTFTVMQVSENVEAHLGLAPRQVLNRPLAELVEPAASDDIRAALLDERWNPLPVSVCGKPFHAIVHRAAGASFVELEPAAASPERVGNHPLRLALKEVQDACTLPRVCQSVVTEVQRLTGFERVMLYRFDEDGHGSVEAEVKRPELEPYLGLHYPASDIPQQARQLYLKNWLRLIPDARYTPVRILPTLRPDSGAPLDLSHSVLRSVSPVHLEYLANLGARASMSISVIVRGRLWGLISCLNHTAPRFLEYELRTACEVLGRLTSLQLAALEDQEATALRAGRRGTQELLVQAMREDAANSDVLGALISRPSELLGLVAAEGVALVSSAEVSSWGRSPPPELTVALSAWLDERGGDAIFATACLPALFAPALEAKDVASGILSFTLPGQPRRRCLWFRPERVQTVSWGGDPRKAVAVDGARRLHPRRSFELWKEAVRLRSLPWTPSDLEAAGELRRNSIEIDLEHQLLRERRAVRARDDLVAVVSHDLKNPLGVIQMQAQVLLGSAKTDSEVPSRRLRASTERIQRSVDRMNALIHDLLDLAAIEAGRFMLQRRSEDVGEVIQEALLILRPLADGKRISIQEDLAVAARIELDRERFFQVLSNLIGNAIKFTPEGGTINIWTERQKDQLLFTVSDTGPGIAAEQVPHVFDRYWQAREQLRHGSGLGLYIAKGIVEAHGGRIWLEPPAGSGAVFKFALALG